MESPIEGEQNMDKQHEVDRVARGLGKEGMSRCLFGDWPRRSLLKLTHPDNDEPSSFWLPREDRAQKNSTPVSLEAERLDDCVGFN